MSKKIDRALYGPSWTEVIFGAVLSMILGFVLAAAYLIFRPATVVPELPKEQDPKVVYFIEGSHDANKARRLPGKQKALAQGQTIALTEDELNIANTPPPPKPGAPEPEPTKFLTPGVPNFRIHDNLLQVAVPVRMKYALFGLDTSVTVHTEGTFAKVDGVFAYVPDTIYLGSCPVHRLPFAGNYIRKGFVAAMQDLPPDVAALWKRLSDVSIDNTTLKLSMPRS